MDGPSAIAFGILIPAVVAGIVLLVAARRARPDPSQPQPFLGALAFGAAWLAAAAGLAGVPPWPGGDTTIPFTGWVFWMVALAVVVAPLRALPPFPHIASSAYFALFSILPYQLIREPSPGASTLRVSGFASVLLVYALWSANERLVRRRPGPSVPLALWAACAGTAAMCIANRSALQAQLVGALAAALGAAVVVALIVRGAHLATGAIAILAVVVASMVRLAVVYDLPHVCWVLVAVAFAAPWLGEIPALRARSPFVAGVLAFVAALTASMTAAWFAFDARPPAAY
jgi:hypothetical protein